MALINQVYSLVNDAVEDALGGASLQSLDTSDLVSLGKAVSSFDAYEGFYRSLVNRIAKTVYFVRTYKANDRHILRDEHEYGAFVQKVYYMMPDAVENPEFDVVSWSGSPATATYSQASPYDVDTVVEISALLYGGQGTWSIEIMRPVSQIKSAFLDESSMMSFIDGIYIAIDNSFKLEQERLVATACNTSIANSIQSGLARNLLDEYNTLNPNNTLTVAEALQSADFLRYACKEIADTIGHMSTMSTLFNGKGYETFTDKDNLVVEMLSSFENAINMYLKADTFHEELISLPMHQKVEYWQGAGTSFAFDDISAIDVTNSALITAANLTGNVAQEGIICFLHDIENVAAYFGERNSWEVYNPRARVINHGEQARKGFAVDTYANSFVFYIEDTSE